LTSRCLKSNSECRRASPAKTFRAPCECLRRWCPRRNRRRLRPGRVPWFSEIEVGMSRSGYHVNLVLTLTINPAIDRTITVDRLVFEDRGYILEQGEVAGGRGINASQVIHAFGGKTLALLTSGGEVGARMEKSLSRMGFPYQAVRVRQE